MTAFGSGPGRSSKHAKPQQGLFRLPARLGRIVRALRWIPAALLLLGSVSRAADDRPNLVLIVSDDQDYEQLGFMGHAQVHTPSLDALARAGSVFPVAHVTMSRCRPTLAGLLDGRFPHQNGIFYNRGERNLSPEQALPRLLRDAGYATFQGGKFWEGDPRDFGFTDVGEDADAFVRESQASLARFLEANAGKRPMFIWWAPKIPHLPHDPPKRFLDTIEEASIPVPAWVAPRRADEFREREHLSLAMVEWLDSGVGELIDGLRAAGVLDSTLCLFLIDNGYANGLVSKGSPAEKGVRTPLVFTWPGHIAAGKRLDALVSTVDVYPTLLDYAGVATPPGVAGVSLRRLLEGGHEMPRTCLYGAIYPPEPELGITPAKAALALYARDDAWKYVLYLQDVSKTEQGRFTAFAATRVVPWQRGQEELFDLRADPHELADLSGDPTQRARMERMRSEVLAWWRDTGGAELDVPAPLSR